MEIETWLKTLYATKTGKIKIGVGVTFVALCLIALISWATIDFTTGKACSIPKAKMVPEHAPHLRGGSEDQPNRDDPVPYQLSLRLHNLSSTQSCRWDQICSAIILDEKTAVTAAQCFKETRDVSRYRVYAGEKRLDIPEEDNEQVLQVRKIIIHPNYTDVLNGSDIAILHVDRIELNKYAQAPLLSPVPTQRLSNMQALTSGWGISPDGRLARKNIQEVNVTILSPARCLFRLEDRWNVPVRSGIVCATDPASRICSDNPGGPLVIQNYNYKLGDSTEPGDLLVGITSFVNTQGCWIGPNWEGGFTEISHFYSWIQENRVNSLTTASPPI